MSASQTAQLEILKEELGHASSSTCIYQLISERSQRSIQLADDKATIVSLRSELRTYEIKRAQLLELIQFALHSDFNIGLG
jgi:hypothetical protein